MTLLLVSTSERARIWRPILAREGIAMVEGEAQVTDPAAITHIACWVPPADLGRYPNLRAVISTGAGVDQMPPMPEGVTLVRTLAGGIDDMVRDWVVMAVLMLQRDLPAYLDQARRGEWKVQAVRDVRTTRVGILGMGRIGQRVAAMLRTFGYEVMGFSRSAAPVEGVEMHGPDGLTRMVAKSDLLICLLPLTDETRGFLGAELFAALPMGAGLVHAGRGAQLDMEAMRAALDTGRLRAAVLDVTDPEPLPQDHWAWADPRLIITPHVAAQTDAVEGAQHVARVMQATREGRPLPGAVDQARGY